MEQKINITYKGKTTTKSVVIPNKVHFDIQRNTRCNVFVDRTKYNRKRKHKNREY